VPPQIKKNFIPVLIIYQYYIFRNSFNKRLCKTETQHYVLRSFVNQ